MPLQLVVKQLNKELQIAQAQVQGITTAIQALNGRKSPRSVRALSKEARQRIGDAQRVRWAKVRKAAKKAA